MVTQEICPNCKMTRDHWTGNEGQGVTKGRQTFCCSGCAEGTGCTCDTEAAEHDKTFAKGFEPSEQPPA